MGGIRTTIYRYEVSIKDEPFCIAVRSIAVEDCGDYYTEFCPFIKSEPEAGGTPLWHQKSKLESLHRSFYKFSFDSFDPDCLAKFKAEVILTLEREREGWEHKAQLCNNRIAGIKSAQPKRVSN